jgi:hypothetical protein
VYLVVKKLFLKTPKQNWSYEKKKKNQILFKETPKTKKFEVMERKKPKFGLKKHLKQNWSYGKKKPNFGLKKHLKQNWSYGRKKPNFGLKKHPKQNWSYEKKNQILV